MAVDALVVATRFLEYSVNLCIPGCFWNRVTQFYSAQFQNGLLSFIFTKKKYIKTE